jgi:hypothetical protein
MKTNVKSSVLMTLVILSSLNALAQIQVVCKSPTNASIMATYRPNSGCINPSSNAWNNKYRLPQTYIPSVNSASITLKITLHVFTKDDGSSTKWENTNSTINGKPALLNYLSDITNGSTERFSTVRSATYSTTYTNTFISNYISDSKIQYEVTNIYYYPSSVNYTYSNGNGDDYEQLQYIESLYPDRLKEGMPIVIADNGAGGSSGYNDLPIVAISVGADPTGNPANKLWFQNHLRHEISHCFALFHLYEGPGAENITCNTIDYLSDVFPSGMTNCPYATTIVVLPPVLAPTNPPCNSCYEYTDVSNNVMGGQGNNIWISPIQMGRKMRQIRLGSISYFAKDVQSDHINTWNITNDEVWDFDIQMYEDIVVKAGVKLTIKCKVAMAMGGKIKVEKLGQLVIDGGEVTTWSKLGNWNGVQIEGDPNQNQLVNNITGYALDQGLLRIINGGKLSRANTAARNYITDVNDNILFGSIGGIIFADNANFIDNARDVEFISYPNFLSSSYFANCQFKTVGNVGPGYVPYAHVSLWNISGVRFRGCNFEYASTNYGGNEGYGIHSIDAAYVVDKLCAAASPSCTTPTTFKNLKQGVRVDNSIPLSAVTIANSQFLDNKIDGAYFHNMNSFVFDNNYLRTNGLPLNSNGLYVNTCKYFTVKNNSFLDNNYVRYNTGAYLFNGQDGVHQMYRNNFAGLGGGILAVDNNSGNSNTTDGLLMNCNDFTTSFNNFDIILLGNGIGLNAPTVMRKQGETFPPAMTATNVVRNKYAAPCGQASKWYAQGAGTNTLIIQHGANSDAFAQPLPQPACSNPIVNVVNSGFPLVYATHCPTALTSGGGNGSTPSAILANINSYIQVLQAQGTNANKFELQAAVAAKQNYYLKDNSSASKDTVINLIKNNRGNMKDADIQLVFAYMNKNDFTNATIKANALPASRADWKALLLKLIAIYKEPNKIYSINNKPAYKTFLQGYANTPYKDGQGIAQSLLKFVSKIEYTEPRPLPIGGGARMMGIDEQTVTEAMPVSKGIQVYPNPTFNGVTLVYNIEQGGQALVEVKDLLGKVTYSNLIVNESNTYIPLESYNSGVYLITVTKDKETLYKTKLIKQE